MDRSVGWLGGQRRGFLGQLLLRERLWELLGRTTVSTFTIGLLAVFAGLVYFGRPSGVDLATTWVVPALLFGMLVHFERVMLPRYEGAPVFRIATWSLSGGVLVTLLILATFELLALKGGRVVGVDFVVLVFAGTGGVVGYVIGIYDVERQREADRAERLHSQVSVLNRVLRHDIRNDATVIRGYADKLADEPAVDRSVIDTIEQRVDDIVELSERARKLERVMNDDVVVRGPVDLAAVVNEQTGRVAAAFPEATVTTHGGSPVRVLAHDLVGSAIYNVVSNAAEHNDADDPQVDVSIDPIDDRWVAVRVRDNGPGIPDGEREVLTSGAESALRHSSGTGLWLVNWIVRLSGGDLAITAREPRGTEVALYFQRASFPP